MTPTEKKYYMQQVGQKINDYLKEKGLTQDQLSISLGKSQATISSWIAARSTISIWDLIKLSEVTGKSIDYFFGHGNEMDEFNESEKRLIRAVLDAWHKVD